MIFIELIIIALIVFLIMLITKQTAIIQDMQIAQDDLKKQVEEMQQQEDKNGELENILMQVQDQANEIKKATQNSVTHYNGYIKASNVIYTQMKSTKETMDNTIKTIEISKSLADLQKDNLRLINKVQALEGVIKRLKNKTRKD